MGLARVCSRCFDPLFRYMERPGDTEEQRAQRKMLFPVVVWTVLGGTLGSYLSAASTPVQLGFFGAVLITAGGFICAMVMLLRARVDYSKLLCFLVLICVAGLLAVDVHSAAWLRLRYWPTVVISMDVLLLFESTQHVQHVVVCLTVATVAAVAFDRAFAFGLLEGTIELGGGRSTYPPVWQCDCAAPPCVGQRALDAIYAWTATSFVFLADYWLTRRFSTQLRSQLNLVAVTVRVAERMARLLADYSTDRARRVVEEEGESLPKALLSSFEQLLDNLDSYRVFLPDSLLYRQQQQQPEEDVFARNVLDVPDPAPVRPAPRAAPGLDEDRAHIAMCFTDIQSSTELWEAHPQGMYLGLDMHNEVMRSTYAACNGYEVKTIGDSFMVAFDSGADALCFGLEAQLGLLRQKWPDDLLTHPLCQPAVGSDGGPLWGGLRVRIGVHGGEARVQRNPVTGRCDYFGPTVNTAARLEGVLRAGGLVAASGTVVDALDREGMQAVGSPVLHDVGDRELRGVREMVKVWAIVPQALAERVAVLAESPRGSFHGSEYSQLSSHSTLPSRPSAATTVERPARRVRDLADRQLRCTGASCACARLSLCATVGVPERYQFFAAAAALAADQTLGVVDGLMSACIAVSWNASKSCADHTAACRRFLSANFRLVVHLGAASGSVLSGSIAAGRRSFAAVVGGCVDLAAALAEEAERCGDSALVVGTVADDCAAVGAAHWAQLWQAPGGRQLVAMAVQPTEDDDQWLLSRDSTDAQEKGQWIDKVAALFRRACTGDPGSEVQQAALSELLEMTDTPGADAAAHLAERISKGGVRARPMPALWDAGRHGWSGADDPATSTA